ncbi:Uncharacterised protein [Starkeya nomas]|uniref:Uncharacterized protein n=1 Tax=Starkeya nomas TaxID=2666134 RepID=A0A5S9NZ50_9HYPH|nr:hypothetical protein [Starkeya nomas]CAA0096187.1 Uncharacterised protein [Starkeya nomas]
MSEPKHGVGAVVSGVLSGTPSPEIPASGAAAQLDLLGNPDAETPVGNVIAKRQGAGRPAGAQNKVTRDIRRLILAKHKHPLLALAEIYSMSVHDLARELGCKPEAALDRQIRAAEAVAPYVAAKQAAVDEHGETAMPTLVMNFGGQAGTPSAGDGARVLSIGTIASQALQYQGVSESERDGSHGEGSHESNQGIDDADETDV